MVVGGEERTKKERRREEEEKEKRERTKIYFGCWKPWIPLPPQLHTAQTTVAHLENSGRRPLCMYT